MNSIKLNAIGLLLVYSSVTVSVDLFHNHTDLVEREDCPACVWNQIFQDNRPEMPLAEQAVAWLSAVNHRLPLPLESESPTECDPVALFHIRAPPAA